MTLTVAVAVIAIAAIMFVAWRTRQRIEFEVAKAVQELQADIHGRQRALDKQFKESVRHVARVERAATKVLTEQRHLQDKTRSLHLQVQQIMLDPKIQAVLEREGVTSHS